MVSGDCPSPESYIEIEGKVPFAEPVANNCIFCASSVNRLSGALGLYNSDISPLSILKKSLTASF